MASTRREKDLARLRAERQAARRAEEAARRKRRTAVLASAVAVIVVVAAVVFLTTRGGGKSTTAATKPPAPGCVYTKAGTASKQVTLPPAKPTATTPVSATMTTDQGAVSFTLDTTKAPCASNAIISLASQHFYDGTPCHRLTSGSLSVLQCGDPTGTGSGGAGYQYGEENLTGAKYTRGTIAMAKSSDPGTTGSQFFLVYKDSDLPAQYTPVGTITAGLDVLDKVAAAGSTPTGDGKPNLPVNIKTLAIGAVGAAAPEVPAVTPTP